MHNYAWIISLHHSTLPLEFSPLLHVGLYDTWDISCMGRTLSLCAHHEWKASSVLRYPYAKNWGGTWDFAWVSINWRVICGTLLKSQINLYQTCLSLTERGNNYTCAYLSFIQHKSCEIVCSPWNIYYGWFNTIINFWNPWLVHSRSFEMD